VFKNANDQNLKTAFAVASQFKSSWWPILDLGQNLKASEIFIETLR